jgi:hypothetical protein
LPALSLALCELAVPPVVAALLPSPAAAAFLTTGIAVTVVVLLPPCASARPPPRTNKAELARRSLRMNNPPVYIMNIEGAI